MSIALVLDRPHRATDTDAAHRERSTSRTEDFPPCASHVDGLEAYAFRYGRNYDAYLTTEPGWEPFWSRPLPLCVAGCGSRFGLGLDPASRRSQAGLRQTLPSDGQTLDEAGVAGHASGRERKELAKRSAYLEEVARFYDVTQIGYPLSHVLTAMRILPRQFHVYTKALMAIRQLFARGVVTYGGFVAEKP